MSEAQEHQQFQANQVKATKTQGQYVHDLEKEAKIESNKESNEAPKKWSTKRFLLTKLQ